MCMWGRGDPKQTDQPKPTMKQWADCQRERSGRGRWSARRFPWSHLYFRVSGIVDSRKGALAGPRASFRENGQNQKIMKVTFTFFVGFLFGFVC